MGYWKLIWRSLQFHWRIHAGAALGAAAGGAVLVGALIVGDSARASLREMALDRLGRIDVALPGGDRFFQDDLGTRFSRETGAETATIIQVSGAAANQDETRRANHVQVLGVTQDFWNLASTPLKNWKPAPDEISLNAALAGQLNAKAGDILLLRIEKPSLLSREAPISPRQDFSVTARLRVGAVVADEQFGRFGLQANQASPLNAFVPLEFLQSKLGLARQANLLVAKLKTGDATTAQAALGKIWRLGDVQAELRPLPWFGKLELRSSRVFLDPPLVEAARKASPSAQPLVTYFVNELSDGGRSTPYSMVTGLGLPIVPTEMKDDEIIVNHWLADDLQAQPGDRIGLKYYVAAGGRLEERRAEFKVLSEIPLAGPAVDRTLMPEFPGIANAEKTENWDAGFPIQMSKIRPKDEQYWKEYRGTPKAFITAAAATNLWSNRFGSYTAVRFSRTPGFAKDPLAGRDGGMKYLEETILAGLKPSEFGLNFQSSRAQALRASGDSQDFAQLFLGFSFFLILAALLLMALLFRLGVEQRAGEIGVLLAVGFRQSQARRLLLGEGLAVSVLGGLAGMAAGSAYAAAMLYGLRTIWRSAVGTSGLRFHASMISVSAGGAASLVVALITIWLALKGYGRQPARVLLNEGGEEWSGSAFAKAMADEGDAGTGRRGGKPGRAWSLWIALGCFLPAAGMTGWGFQAKSSDAAGLFFGAGALLLAAGIAGAAYALRRFAGAKSASRLTLGRLGLRACGRRPKRSLATAGLLACGSFLVVAVGANKLDAVKDSDRRSSGTGGFAFFGDSTFPVVQDLNEPAGRDFFGLKAAEMDGAKVVSLRVREGDDASCLNLNRPQTPRLLGVRPQDLASRGAFTFSEAPGVKPGENPWLLLNGSSADGAVPAIADQNTLEWALHLGVGDTLNYVDERGGSFKIKIAGAIANSILQGSLLISEERFLEHFPSESGYRMFLVDAPSNRAASVGKALTRALQDTGLALTPATGRLAEFNAVENTYLDTFQVLGGLGLLLGSAGLGVVVLRNVLERKGELAVLRAVGFSRPALRWMVMAEHSALLALGLALGVVAALIAALPAVVSQGGNVPYLSLSITLAAIFASGLVWTRAATSAALRGPMMEGLRNNC